MIIIKEASNLNLKTLREYHNSRFEVITKKNENAIGYHNLIYVGNNSNEVEKMAKGHYVCPSDITKEELWSCHQWYVTNNFPDSLYELFVTNNIVGRKSSLIALIRRLKALLLSSQDICLAFFSESDKVACNILSNYIGYLEKIVKK